MDAPSEYEDPARFPPTLGDLDLYLIAQGTHRRLWTVLGAHVRTVAGVDGTSFAVWAPNARAVSVVGDFNAWDGRRCPLRRLGGSGVWEAFVPNVRAGASLGSPRAPKAISRDSRCRSTKCISVLGRAFPRKGIACLASVRSRHGSWSMPCASALLTWN